MSDVAAIVLAAGLSSRFRAAAGASGPASKLVADYHGEPLARYVVAAALASRARPVMVVTGHARAEVEAALHGLDVTFVHNPDFATGMASSLKAGVSALPSRISGALILLADMPSVSAAVIDRLIATFQQQPQASAIVPVFTGRRGNPVLIAQSLFKDIIRLEGDAGARPLLATAANIIEAPIDDAGVVIDIDTPDALTR